MGVAGSGKTTIGKMLASELGWEFVDGDDHHSPQNIEKMRSGIALTDADRLPWLESLRGIVEKHLQKKTSLVLACSALKQSYRQILQVSPEVKLVYLKGSAEILQQRLQSRRGHYMTELMLASQLGRSGTAEWRDRDRHRPEAPCNRSRNSPALIPGLMLRMLQPGTTIDHRVDSQSQADFAAAPAP